MGCPACHTAGSWHFEQPPKFSQLERAAKSEPMFPEILRAVKRPLGTGKWVCSFCHYERPKQEARP